MRVFLSIIFTFFAGIATAAPLPFSFENIDGGTHDMSQWAGRPVLVVNTASQCGFTPQYEGLQTLYDTYKDRGLVVLAVPSDDFNQELTSNTKVKEFCELTYGIDLPMTSITHVKGRNSHPFFGWVKDQTGFVPRWNFNKVLIGKDGTVLQTWGSTARPMSGTITKAVEKALR